MWDDVKRFLRQGAYRDALQTLETLHVLTPNDPQILLYRSLCQTRLRAASGIDALTPEELSSLQQRLREEERAQRRWAKQQKTLERQLRSEQERWDQELATLQRQAQRQGRAQRQEVQADAVQEAKTQRAQQRALRRQEALEQVEVTEAARETAAKEEPRTPEAPAGPPTISSADARSVELAPVTVPTTGEDEAQEQGEAMAPSLVGRTPPPAGAVQINAYRMTMSPDRKVAIAEGSVEVIFENALLTCDRMTLFTDTKDVYAEGSVRLEEGTQVFRGEMAHYNFATKKGRFLQGTISTPPWHQHGRSVEHVAEGVYETTPGYITSCDQEPPHFKFYGRRTIVFSDDKLAKVRNMAFLVDRVPFFYLPWITVADRKSPFFIIPGKKKPWEAFALMGYRYELPHNNKGTLRLDWRRAFGWGVGVDHQFESKELGKGLLKVYYNDEPNRRVMDPKATLPKGAADKRYRVLWRHLWQVQPDTTMLTNIQEVSDENFRKDFLFREEFVNDDNPESFVSVIKSAEAFTLSGLARKRMNRFETVDEVFPQLTLDVREQRIGDSWLFSETKFDVANFQTKRTHSDNDTDVIRLDWFQEFSYALGLFRPIEMTPRAGIRQSYYTKDRQGGVERPQGKRDVLSGQANLGVDASLKLFRIFPVSTNFLGLNINVLRHVLTPTIGYTYVHQATVPNELLNFAAAGGPSNQVSFSLENKLQTKRKAIDGKLQAVDLARLVTSLPYTFQGAGNKEGGQLGDWTFDLELYPRPWLRLESDWTVTSHLDKRTRDTHLPVWNVDVVMVGGRQGAEATGAPGIQAPTPRAFEPGPHPDLNLLPQGQWYFGLGHRYSQNDKTEDVLQFDWRLSDKWEIGTFHRITWKEVSGTSKRFGNVREYQYRLRRDLHDWIGEVVYRVDREFGEELFLTFTLKAYPDIPIEIEDSYHQPKIASQSSPFSPLRITTP
ncbi:MAG: hypothetical protein COV75_02500 [Candidatus Omnitrophica bacterium CG11_big_fil_rev_8_21_14_0_20_63_9]|nr:MAG: hypothetical protein COV75_02500 [Candidatus Omnitrophica bacterium CG11_big_fil_rev_8_21_14_0_20_63_9]